MAKLADARDLKSRGEKSPCGFDPRSGHFYSYSNLKSTSRGYVTVGLQLRFALGLWRFLAQLCLILSSELGFEFGVANETLGVRSFVLLAPVPLALKVGSDF